MTAKAELYDRVMDFDSGYFEELLESKVAFYIYKNTTTAFTVGGVYMLLNKQCDVRKG